MHYATGTPESGVTNCTLEIALLLIHKQGFDGPSILQRMRETAEYAPDAVVEITFWAEDSDGTDDLVVSVCKNHPVNTF